QIAVAVHALGHVGLLIGRTDGYCAMDGAVLRYRPFELVRDAAEDLVDRAQRPRMRSTIGLQALDLVRQSAIVVKFHQVFPCRPWSAAVSRLFQSPPGAFCS